MRPITIYMNKFLTIAESNRLNNQIEHFYYLKTLPYVYRTTNFVEVMILAYYYSNARLDINRVIPSLNFSYFNFYRDITKHCSGIIEITHMLRQCYESIYAENFDISNKYEVIYNVEPKILEIVYEEYNKISSNIKYGIKYSELLDILNSNPFFVLDNHIAFNVIDEIVEKERKRNNKNA